VKNVKKIVTVIICVLLVLTTANIAYAEVNAGSQTAGTQTTNNLAATPTTAITLPVNNAHIYNTYTVTGTASDEKMSSWELDYGAGPAPTSWKTINSGTASIVGSTLGIWYIGSFANGSVYTLKLTATNKAGKISQATSTITIDSTVAPSTDMSIPSNTSYINGIVSVLGTVSDQSLSNWKLDYGIGNSPEKWTVLTTGTTPVSNKVIYQWDTSPLKNGELYTIRLSATDQGGNYSQTTKHLTKKTTIPAANISSPANDAHISGTYKVTGSVSGTKLEFWELDYGSGTNPAIWTKISSGISPVTNVTLGNWNTSSFAVGSVYTLQLTVKDLAGTRIQSVSQVTIDSQTSSTSAPIIMITTPANNSNAQGNETVTGTISDTNMGRWVLEFGSGTSPAGWTEIQSGLTSVTNGTLGSWDTTALAAGIYTVRLREIDVKGNTNQATVQVTVGTPAANLNTPSPGSNASGAAPATGTATDVNSNNRISERIAAFFNGLGTFFKNAFDWITGK
jgi:hypothetical protein